MTRDYKVYDILIYMFLDPLQTLSVCNLQTTDIVADFGAGSGFVAHAAAKLVPHGQVFAIEINKDIVARLTREITERHVKNIIPLWGDIEVTGGTQLKDGSVDFVILSNIFFQLEDRAGCLNEVRRVLRDEGRVLLVDWSESFSGMGPMPHQVFTKQMAEDLFARLRFTKLSDSIPAGEHHYGLLFKK